MGIIVREFLKDGQIVTCRGCKTHLALQEDLISKEFQGQHGRAYLYVHVTNIDEGPEEQKSMTTGQHVVKDISCKYCGKRLGWKYVKAYESSQKYKAGRFILERALVSDVNNPLAERQASPSAPRSMSADAGIRSSHTISQDYDNVI